MKKVEIKTQITVFDSYEELSNPVKVLMNSAIEAKNNAYAPYILWVKLEL